MATIDELYGMSPACRCSSEALSPVPDPEGPATASSGHPADNASRGGIVPVTELLQRVLRVSPEPCLHVSDQRVHEIISADIRGFIAHLRTGLSKVASDELAACLPRKQVFKAMGEAGDFRVMPCILGSGEARLKIVKIIGTNKQAVRIPDQISVGQAFLLDANDNYITHAFQACLLSSARTGACALLAIEKLARRHERVRIIGAGRVGYYCGLFCSLLPGIREVVLADQDPGRADAAAGLLQQQCPSLNYHAAAAYDPGASDVLILATSSSTAFCRPPSGNADLVISLGADTDDQHELDEAWLGLSRVYVDSLDAIHYGDLKTWSARGLIDNSSLTELLALYRQPADQDSGRVRLFISTGTALFDALTIGFLRENLAQPE